MRRISLRRACRWPRCWPRPRWRKAPPPAISVTGEATVSVAPDLAQIDGGVTSEAKTAREASDANNAAMGKVLLALKGAGIDEKDYQTSRLSLQPQYAQPPNRTGPQQHHRLSRQQPRHHQGARRHQGRQHDRHAGRRRRQRDRRHQFHGVAGLESARRGARARRSPMRAARPRSMPRPPASRSARRSAFPKKARPAADVPQQDGRGDGLDAPVAQGEETLSVTVSVSWAIKPRQ